MKLVITEIIMHQLTNQKCVTHHLTDSVKTFPMKAEGLFKQYFVLNTPFIWEWSEIGQVCKGLVYIVLVPE